ncbi:Frag1/DRAM/Sfk1 family-domain-containing protein [Xylariomycetidae sp. FL2044]|nr:Frag1/DRAM/Sfk1 family-domain-containing protein [Xylariomycetidae sp. FL2044]
MKLIHYWVFPVVSGLMWLATLLGLLLHWIVDEHRKRYPSMEDGQTIAYISDVGAQELKPLFVAGCIITTLFLDLSFGSDRWLRHRGRLVPNTSTFEKVLSGLTIAFAVVGTVGLTCLSGFDTYHYPMLHDIFLLLFIAGYLLSAIFICWEYQRLGKKNRHHRILKASFWIKLIFVIVELLLAIAFAVCNFRDMWNAAAVLEWTIAFIFSFYIWSFFIDLYPAASKSYGARHPAHPGMNTAPMAEDEEGRYYGSHHPHNHHNNNNVLAPPRATHDSDRTLTNGQHPHHHGANPLHRPKNGHTDF